MSEHKKPVQSSNSSAASVTTDTASTEKTSHWTGNINTSGEIKLDKVLTQMCHAFNASPYFAFNKMKMIVEDHQIKCILDMNDNLIGNVAFRILHGGATATLLDSVGGIVAMSEIYKRASKDETTEMLAKLTRLATVDMRVDYIAPGRGQRFIGTAEVLRMGRKGCTMRMNMHNNEGKLIATGIATYAY
jgi:uncharacterized protein (TIGR00369 family)